MVQLDGLGGVCEDDVVAIHICHETAACCGQGIVRDLNENRKIIEVSSHFRTIYGNLHVAGIVVKIRHRWSCGIYRDGHGAIRGLTVIIGQPIGEAVDATETHIRIISKGAIRIQSQQAVAHPGNQGHRVRRITQSVVGQNVANEIDVLICAE